MIRKGAQRLELTNEGVVVFLYDEANREKIAKSEPELVDGFAGPDDLDDKTLRSLARRGLLVAYEKLQDDDLRLEVAVGQPLRAGEARCGHWLEAQAAFLRLPTGKLCVETYSSLRLGAETPDEPGGLVEVEPGDYVVTLHRLDLLAWEEDGSDSRDLPDEFLALTPLEETEKPAQPPAMLQVGRDPEDVSWVGSYEIDNGVFRGLVTFWSHQSACRLNLDEEAAAMLDLLPGMGLRLEVESLSFEFEAFFLGDEACMASTIREAWAEHAGTELAEAVWLDDSEISARTLAVGGLDPAARVYAGRWLPVTLELVPMPAALSES